MKNHKRERNIFQSRLEAVGCAFRGFGLVLYGEQSAWIHSAATLLVLVAAALFLTERWEWVALLCCITLVWVAEILNSAIEILADKVSPEYCEAIRDVKDVAASAVMIAAFGAVVSGLFLFLPHFL